MMLEGTAGKQARNLDFQVSQRRMSLIECESHVQNSIHRSFRNSLD